MAGASGPVDIPADSRGFEPSTMMPMSRSVDLERGLNHGEEVVASTSLELLKLCVLSTAESISKRVAN